MWATCPLSASSGYHAEFHEGCYQKHTNPSNCRNSSLDISGYHLDFHEGHDAVGEWQGCSMAWLGNGMGVAWHVWISLMRTSWWHAFYIHVRQLQPNNSATQIMKKDLILWHLTFLGVWQRNRFHIHSVYWMELVSAGWIFEHVWCAMSATRIIGPIFSESVLSRQFFTYILTPLWNSGSVNENILLSFQQDCISSHHKQLCFGMC
jgi:hypothetical protein